jgi:hypothetical protein
MRILKGKGLPIAVSERTKPRKFGMKGYRILDLEDVTPRALPEPVKVNGTGPMPEPAAEPETGTDHERNLFPGTDRGDGGQGGGGIRGE